MSRLGIKYGSLICYVSEHDCCFEESYGIQKTHSHYRDTGESVDGIARAFFGIHRFSDYIAFRLCRF